ncbi:sensor domain-containing protein [Caproiciproducens sp. MSJ-32]|uniref:sensor domain-containing protein n=1 Tax=Caproiciproducens sp. MSJ-32 TaxID=2841527 RepID=UPI002ED6AF76
MIKLGRIDKRLAFVVIAICFFNDDFIFGFIVLINLILIISLIYLIKKYRNLYKLSEVNKNKYNLAIDFLEAVLWEWNCETEEFYISSKIKNLLSIDKEEIKLEDLFSYITQEDRNELKLFFDEMIKDKIIDSFSLETNIINNLGQRLTVEMQIRSNFRDGVFIISGMIKDITAKKQQENINKAIENKNRLAVEGSKDIAFWWNVRQNVISLNKRIREYIDFEGEKDIIISYTKWRSYIYKDDLAEYDSQMMRLISSKTDEFYSMEFRILTKDNEIRWLESKGKKTLEKNGDVFIFGALSDITARKEKELENSFLSYFDEVTGITNRRYFIKEVGEYIEKNPKGSFAVIFIDLDNFKFINDTYGHDVGDLLLVEFTNIINGMKIENSLFSRYGGDEFLLVKYNVIEIEDLKIILDNLIKELSKPIAINDIEVFCTLSIGVSIYPADGKDIGTLLKRADMAMYLAKINGKNRYEIFDMNMLEILNREFEIEKRLRVALDNNEIKVLYQPKIDTETEEVLGFEALVRWNCKALGMVSPKEFIPIAESSGLIIPIGNYIIEECIKKCKELSIKTNKKFKMAINLSDVQIRSEKILPFIEETLEKYDLDASYIEFEITESVIMKYPEKNIEKLKQLKKLGVSLALDDFGTGYSSLSYLRILPIDSLKIDKSFIDGIVIEEKSEYIIDTIIELSHYLNLIVVAEGVETKEQYDYLKSINCDLIQGYYFSKPLEFIEAEKLLL